MNKDDLILISVDDHMVEPPDVFEGRLPKKYVENAPRVVRVPEGDHRWIYDDIVVPNFGLNAVAGRPPEEYGMDPNSYEDIRVGTYNVHERVKDMSANGVLASLNFPTFPRFAGQVFAEHADRDPDRAYWMVRAYNDWHVDGWCGEYPDRFVPCGITPLWDPELQAKEVRRLAEKKCHASHSPRTPTAWLSVAALGSLGSVLGGLRGEQDRRLPAFGVVVAAAHDRPRRAFHGADHRDRHQSLRLRLGPRMVADLQEVPRPEILVVRGLDRLDSVILGAGGLHVHAPQSLDRR